MPSGSGSPNGAIFKQAVRLPQDVSGIPPGLVPAVVEIVRTSPRPIRRRAILAELESRGRRLSLAGLNRILEHCQRTGMLIDSPEGVRLAPGTPPSTESPTISPR